MTTKHVPLCQTRGCPRPNDPDWHRCFVCNKEPIDHQHYPKKSLAGKGAKIVAALCRYHHERITLHEWREGVYRHGDGSLRYYVQNLKGEEQCERIIEAAPSSPSGETRLSSEPSRPITRRGPTPPRPKKRVVTVSVPVAVKHPYALDHVPDEQLAALFAEADKRQAEGFLLKCRIVHTFRERHVQAWGSSWTESAYELFHISRRTLNAYANLHEILDTSDPYLVENIGPLTDSRGLMSLIGRKKPEDGKRVLEAAVSYLAKYAEPPTVPALLHQMGVEAKPPETCPESEDGRHGWLRKCRSCGKEA